MKNTSYLVDSKSPAVLGGYFLGLPLPFFGFPSNNSGCFVFWWVATGHCCYRRIPFSFYRVGIHRETFGRIIQFFLAVSSIEVVKTEPVLTNPLSLRAAANNVRKITKVKIGAIEKDENGTPTKYGININNDEGETVFTTGDDGNITITGTINAAAGNIGGFNVTDELSSGDFNQPGSIYLSPNHHGILYLDGLNEENDWVITAGDNFGVTSDGIMYSNNAVVRGTIYATDGEFTGHVNAESGNFRGNILVGNSNDRYITINSEGIDPIIASSDYIHNTTAGWMINGTGDAIFNNVSVRGAIKTAVFEYSEIEAVGGAFLFRPSSSIKTAQIDGNDIILTVEKPQLFKQYEWVKLSNCNSNDAQLVNDGGLTHVYKVGNIPATDNYVVLLDAGLDFTSVEVISDSDYYYYDQTSGERVEHNPDDEDDLIEITEYDDRYYYEIENFQLENEKQYYISYNFQKYLKEAQAGHISYYIGQPGDEEPVFQEEDVIYIGNLAIFDSGLSNTGETFLIITNSQDITRIYSTQEGSAFFYIQKIEVKSNNVAELEGGALISFGYYDNDTQYEKGIHNYGIGINSSDNYVGLPERAISLFESKIHPDQSVKVTYDYKGILGTLPDLGSDIVDRSVFANNMAGTQGIFTNNMYIGDNTQYLAFYTDKNGNKQLKIKANQVVYEVPGEEGEESEWQDIAEAAGVPGPAGDSAFQVIIASTIGSQIINGQGIGAVYAFVTHEDIIIDQIPTNIEAGFSEPLEPQLEDYFIKLKQITDIQNPEQSYNIATLVKFNGEEWIEVKATCGYKWTFRDSNNNIITTNVPYQDDQDFTKNQCIYIDGNLINGRITIDVEVIIN